MIRKLEPSLLLIKASGVMQFGRIERDLTDFSLFSNDSSWHKSCTRYKYRHVERLLIKYRKSNISRDNKSRHERESICG